MRLFHATPRRNVPGMLANGFIDPHAGRFVDAGVWFADRPLIGDEMFADEEGPFGGVSIEIPEQAAAEYEQEMPEGSDHREWHIPHDVANECRATMERIEFYPKGYVQTYDGYWIIRETVDATGGQMGGRQLSAAIPLYQAVDPETLEVLAENNRLPEIMLTIHNELPTKSG